MAAASNDNDTEEVPEDSILDRHVSSDFSLVESSDDNLQSLRLEFAAHKQDMREKMVANTKSILSSIQKIQQSLSTLAAKLEESTKKAEPQEIDETQLEEQLNSARIEVSFLRLEVAALQATSVDGSLTWIIPKLEQKRDESESGVTPYIVSPSFHTSKSGYKACAHFYAAGDGDGKGTHLSLYLSIVKGSFDAVLEWPFSRRVKFIVMSQKPGRQSIVKTFKPGPSTFPRPISAKGIAVGYAQLAPQSLLRDQDFVVDDVLYLKIIIDT